MMYYFCYSVETLLQRERVRVVLRADMLCRFLRSLEVRRALQSHREAM